MSQQSVRQAARRWALDAQAVRRKERADLRAGQTLLTMIDEERLSVRETVEWCGSGATVREISRLRRLDRGQQGGGRE